jgi:hypothetical protein
MVEGFDVVHVAEPPDVTLQRTLLGSLPHLIPISFVAGDRIAGENRTHARITRQKLPDKVQEILDPLAWPYRTGLPDDHVLIREAPRRTRQGSGLCARTKRSQIDTEWHEVLPYRIHNPFDCRHGVAPLRA